MERRRRALGLKRPSSENEIQNFKEQTQKKLKCHNNILPRKTEEKTCTKGDRESPSEVACVTHQQRTPKRPVQALPPPVSPGPEPVFPSILGSPEIEVSWDWGCSQVPKDMLPPKQVKRNTSNQPRQPSPLVSPVVRGPMVIQRMQMSEEENQARLAFYKNVLSQASKCKKEEHFKTDDIIEQNDKTHPNSTTPKRSIIPLVGGKNQISEMLDDSVDEFMVECSQAIEEQLKSGQINLGSNVNIKVPDQKHVLSPDLQPENPHKRVCHGKSKLNLFPESPKTSKEEVKVGVEKRRLSLKSPKNQLLKKNSSNSLKPHLVSNENISSNIEADLVSLVTNNQSIVNNFPSSINTDNYSNHSKNKDKVVFTNNDFEKLRLNEQRNPGMLNRPSGDSNCSTLEKRYPITKHELTLNNNCISHSSSVQTKRVQENVNNAKYDSIDKFRRTSKSVYNSNNKQVVNKANGTCNPVINNLPKTTINQVIDPNQIRRNTPNSDIKTIERRQSDPSQETKQQCNDLTSLLDDGFDMELSSLDFDSLCNSQEAAVPKVCTQDEIEAKRKAALSRLMMKKRR